MCVVFTYNGPPRRTDRKEQTSLAPIILLLSVTPQASLLLMAMCFEGRWAAFHFLVSWIGLEMQEGFQTSASMFNMPPKKSQGERAVTLNLGQEHWFLDTFLRPVRIRSGCM